MAEHARVRAASGRNCCCRRVRMGGAPPAAPRPHALGMARPGQSSRRGLHQRGRSAPRRRHRGHVRSCAVCRPRECEAGGRPCRRCCWGKAADANGFITSLSGPVSALRLASPVPAEGSRRMPQAASGGASEMCRSRCTPPVPRVATRAADRARRCLLTSVAATTSPATARHRRAQRAQARHRRQGRRADRHLGRARARWRSPPSRARPRRR